MSIDGMYWALRLVLCGYLTARGGVCVSDARTALRAALQTLRSSYVAFAVADQLKPYIRASVEASASIAHARAARKAAEAKTNATGTGTGGVSGSPAIGPVRGTLASPVRPETSPAKSGEPDEKEAVSGGRFGRGVVVNELNSLSGLQFELKTASEPNLLSVVINDFPLVWPVVGEQYISYELIALRVGKMKHPTHFGENSGMFASARRLVLNYAGMQALASRVAIEAKADHVRSKLPAPMALDGGGCCGDGWEWSHTQHMNSWLAKIQAEGSPAIEKALAAATLSANGNRLHHTGFVVF